MSQELVNMALMDLQNLSGKDRFFSSPIWLYIRWIGCFLLLFFLISLVIQFRLKGWKFFVALIIITGIVGYLGFKVYVNNHLKSPLRKAFFKVRLSLLLTELNSIIDKKLITNLSNPMKVKFTKGGEGSISYSMNIWAAQKVIPGTPITIPRGTGTLFYWEIIGKTNYPDAYIVFGSVKRLKNETKVEFFSGLGGKRISVRDEQLLSLSDKLKKLLPDYFLMGKIEIKNRQFRLILYDNAIAIHPATGEVILGGNRKSSVIDNMATKGACTIVEILLEQNNN